MTKTEAVKGIRYENGICTCLKCGLRFRVFNPYLLLGGVNCPGCDLNYGAGRKKKGRK